MPLDSPRTIRSLPRSFTSKRGELVRLALLDHRDRDRLVAMYLAYQPRASFQGLPPLKDVVCVQWVHDMVRTGVNVVALAGGAVVGHIALFRVNRRKCEMLVVVSPAQQDSGIGTELTRSIVLAARELGFEKMWLPVAASNLRARHVYQKCGFRYVSDKLARELDMELDLTAVEVEPAETSYIDAAEPGARAPHAPLAPLPWPAGEMTSPA